MAPDKSPSTACPSADILTLPEAASYLRVSEDVVSRLASEQMIPARKVGNDWRFLRAALEDWLRGPSGGAPAFAPVLQWLRSPLAELLLDELEWRLQKKSEAAGRPIPKGNSRERLLGLAGAWKDDPSLNEMLEEIYKRRGRPMTEEAE